jgi:cytochrome c553
MKRLAGFLSAFSALVLVIGMDAAAQRPPSWAYNTEPTPGAEAEVPDTKLFRLPGSSVEATRPQIRSQFGPVDWYPNDHPKMPDVVARGRQPDVRACSWCHYPNGKGRPENAGVSGLPVSYFIQQLKDFKDGNRKSADPKKGNAAGMARTAAAMSEDEMKAAAEYFGAIRWTPWIKVVETDTVPKTHVAGGMFLVVEGGGKEPIGRRIIETPVDTEATEILRNPRSGFIAYVPVGSLKKGEALVKTGGGKTTQCGACHGADLNGLGPVPGIAGRSPSYLMRQMYDMQQGTRKGLWSDLMKPVVAGLNEEDMLNIVAYVSSGAP